MTVPSAVRDAALSADNKILVWAHSSSAPGNISIFKMSTGAVVGQLNCPSSPISVAVSPTGRLVAAANSDRNVYVWDLAKKTLAAPLTGLGSTASDVAISPDEKLIAACALNRVIVWDLANGKMVSQSPPSGAPPSGSMHKLTFSPDSRQLLCAGMMNEISVIDIQNGTIIQKLSSR